MTSSEKGFTLVELLVVVGMILVIMSAMSSAVTGAIERARIQKATSEVKVITQAILGYENETRNGTDFELPVMTRAECGADTLGFLLGGENGRSGRIPVLLQTPLTGGGKLLDPWGHPYLVTIKKTTQSPNFKTMTGAMQTGYHLPNFFRVREGER